MKALQPTSFPSRAHADTALRPNSLKEILEAAEVTHPQPGQQLTAVLLRRAYEREASVILVDSAVMASINAMTSEADAFTSKDSAIDRAVRKRSYTAMAASASSLRPLRFRISSRASKASTFVNVFIDTPIVKASL